MYSICVLWWCVSGQLWGTFRRRLAGEQ